MHYLIGGGRGLMQLQRRRRLAQNLRAEAQPLARRRIESQWDRCVHPLAVDEVRQSQRHVVAVLYTGDA